MALAPVPFLYIYICIKKEYPSPFLISIYAQFLQMHSFPKTRINITSFYLTCQIFGGSFYYRLSVKPRLSG